MISGTFVLTDTIDKAFDSLFTDSYTGTDVVISGTEIFEIDFGQPPPFDESLYDDVIRVDGVDAATRGIGDFAQLTDQDDEPITTGGAPTLGFGLDAQNESFERFNPLVLEDGAWPVAPGQVAIDPGTATKHGYVVGDTIGVRARGPVEDFELVGIARFGSVDSIGGATVAYFSIEEAQRVFEKEGLLDGIQVAAAPGTTPQQLIDGIEPILLDQTQVLTGEQQASEDSRDVEEFTSFIQWFLLAFGGIALFVGAFVIFNTLSITVAQRTREFATLRTLGGSRRQVLTSVVLEAFVIGFLASLVGLFVGLGLAAGLNEVFVAFGIDLPSSGTVFAKRTIVVSLIVGTLVTVAAGIAPAIRATRVAPIAAVREGTTPPPGRLARLAPLFSILTVAAGLVAVLVGIFWEGLGIGWGLGVIGIGVVLLFVGIALVSARLVAPLAAVIGTVSVRLGGVPGKLARDNATRNPGRTASTAAALMIGLALVTFVAVLASGLTKTVEKAIDDQVATDYVVVSENGFTPFEPGVDTALAADASLTVSPVRGENVRAIIVEADGVNETDAQLSGVDPATVSSVYRFDWVSGSDALIESLGPDEAVIERDFADDNAIAVGDQFTVQASSGAAVEVAAVGIYDAPAILGMLGDITVPIATFDELIDGPRNLYTFVRVEGGASPTATNSLESALAAGFPGIELDTQQEFKDRNEENISQFLNLLFVLLALSVVVSLFGMVNTLILSVFERTRELGMLRAVGMTRRQTRRMIRHESVITALIGAAIGIPFGVGLAAIITTRLSDQGFGFAVPWSQLVIFAIIAVIAGILAAVFPARRAARLNVLRALQYE
jgi:putative ABC transport system permease protein